jgi:hypothetical protein
MGDWATIIPVGAGVSAVVLLQRISRQIETLNEKLADLLAHEGVKGYDTDADPD